MKHPRPLLTHLLLTLHALLAAGCSAGNFPGGDTGMSPGQPSPALCENPYLPVKRGATWTYTSTGGPSGAIVYTETITEVHTDGFLLTIQFPDLVQTQEWKCTPEGLQAFGPGSGATASLSAWEMTSTFTATEAGGISLPKAIAPGMKWQFSLKIQGTTATPSDDNARSEGVLSAVMQETGRETVAVPGGTFEAVKIQAAVTMQITADFQGIPLPIAFNGSSVIWLAPGVGYVKIIENSDFGGAPFTITTELQSYDIP